MKSSDIFKGQVYTTEMIGRFNSENKPLLPIKILANVEGFIIFERDGFKSAMKVNYFKSQFITACKYKLKKAVHTYELSSTLPLKLVKKKI